jgi:hypothetical protein
MATALALAASTSILCLSIIYTVDWSADTRIKGVLSLVVLAYFIGFTLYFTDKTTLERLYYYFGEQKRWKEFKPQQGPHYRVKLPGEAMAVAFQPLPPLATLHCYQSRVPDQLLGWQVYVVGAGDPVAGEQPPGSDAWFQVVRQHILMDGAQLQCEWDTPNGFLRGRTWEIQWPGSKVVRIVRIYASENRVYYLSVEGEQLHMKHPEVVTFLQSFFIPQP